MKKIKIYFLFFVISCYPYISVVNEHFKVISRLTSKGMRNKMFAIKVTAQQNSFSRFILLFTRWLKYNEEKQIPKSINPNENKSKTIHA